MQNKGDDTAVPNVDAIVARYKADRMAGRVPSIAETLARCPAEAQPRLAMELAKTDAELRTKAGEQVGLEAFDAALPYLGNEQRNELSRFMEECGRRFMQDTAAETSATDSGMWPSIGASTTPDEESPPVIPRYNILRRIGQGGMGSVWEAEQTNPRRIVALKVIKRGLSNRELVRRFQLEAEVLGRLQHPGIARIFEAGSADSGFGPQPYFVMELIRPQAGKDHPATITEYADQNELNTQQRLELLAKVSDAVHYAHQQGVIHRDLKPGNILVDAEGQPKVLDFGVARVTDADVQVTTMQTDVGQIIGTLPYMSPEQAAGQPTQLDTRSDVYALGVIAYELLTGERPYDLERRMVVEAVRIICEAEPTRLSVFDRTFRGDVETIVAKAMEKEKAHRYQSASDLAADIRRFLNDEPIAARPAGRWYQLKKFSRRNRALVTGVAATIVALAFGLAGMTWQAVKLARAEAAAQKIAVAERQQRELADKRFGELRNIANVFMFEVHDQIATLPGSTPARQTLAVAASKYLQNLQRDAGSDVSLKQELTVAYRKVSSAQLALGDLAGAMDSATRAVDLAKEGLVGSRVAESYLRFSEALSQLAAVHSAALDNSRYAGTVADSLDASSRALELDPGSKRAALKVISDLRNSGRAKELAGDFKGALELYAKSLTAARTRLEQNGNDPACKESVARSLRSLAYAQMLTGDQVAKMASSQEALRIWEELVAAAPDNASYQANLIGALIGVGDALKMKGEVERSLTFYQRTREIAEAMTAADPRNTSWAISHSYAYINIGDAYFKLERFVEAEPAYAHSMRIREKTVAMDPRNLSFVRDLGMARYKLAMTEMGIARASANAGNPAEADAHWRRAEEHIAHAKRLVEPLEAQKNLRHEDAIWFWRSILEVEKQINERLLTPRSVR